MSDNEGEKTLTEKTIKEGNALGTRKFIYIFIPCVE